MFCEVVGYTLELLEGGAHQGFHAVPVLAFFQLILSDSCRDKAVNALLYVALQGDGG